jgi:hypothetical protein
MKVINDIHLGFWLVDKKKLEKELKQYNKKNIVLIGDIVTSNQYSNYFREKENKK